MNFPFVGRPLDLTGSRPGVTLSLGQIKVEPMLSASAPTAFVA
jgi:hypothetical protein